MISAIANQEVQRVRELRLLDREVGFAEVRRET
jgi:hypothetical protein